MPAGLEVTVPCPVPAIVTLSAYWGMRANVAVIVAAALTVGWHVVAVPLQPPPLQPLKVDPLVTAAVRVTAVPCAKEAEQVPVVQLMPAGLEVTVP